MYYYSLNQYLKHTYGCKVYKLSLNAGLSCPNRDGTISTGGCIFCSEGGSGDFASSHLLPIPQQITKAKEKVSKKITSGKYIAYFQAYTNTYGSIDYLRKIYYEAINDPDIVGLSIGTRPDCLSDEVLSLLSEINNIKPVWIELGLQTTNEQTASFINRGYSLDIFDFAVEKLNELGIDIIVHVIVGLPYETKEDIYNTIEYISNKKISGIKLQLLHILKNTKLADIYSVSQFHVLTMEEYFEIIGHCIELLPPNIVIHRLTGDGPKSLLLEPLWSANKKLVLNSMNQYFVSHDIVQGRLYNLYN